MFIFYATYSFHLINVKRCDEDLKLCLFFMTIKETKYVRLLCFLGTKKKMNKTMQTPNTGINSIESIEID